MIRKNHEYGLYIIEDIVDKYHGTYLYEYHDPVFLTYVSMTLEGSRE